MKRSNPAVLLQRSAAAIPIAVAALSWGCGQRAAPAPAADKGAPETFLTARLRGAIDADLAWRGPDLQSEGGARPDGRGIRVSLAGPLTAGGQRLRLVFGMAAAPGLASARAVPTNLTLIVEGANRVFATLGDERCSVDALTQQPATRARAASGAGPAASGDYWVSARGFCLGPASTLDGGERVLLNRFDFRGRIHVDEADLHATANGS